VHRGDGGWLRDVAGPENAKTSAQARDLALKAVRVLSKASAAKDSVNVRRWNAPAG
jgi:hypothetical protein